MTPTQLRAARQRLKLTQVQAAALLSADLRTVQRWESGAQPVRESAAQLLRMYLNGAPLPELPPAPGRGRWRREATKKC